MPPEAPVREREAGCWDGLRMNPVGGFAGEGVERREREGWVESPVDPARAGGFGVVDESLLESESPLTPGIGRAV